VGVLARIFEEAGIATVGLSLVRRQAENIKAPRFLHCEFPLGRPLGHPDDPDFQKDVMRRAFALLERNDVPVLVDHPETIIDEADEAASCVLPPRHDPDLHPAVDELLALRPAYRRQVEAAQGRTAVGRVAAADALEQLVVKFVAIGDGATLSHVDWDPDSVRAASQDLRAYYEEAAIALSDHVLAARQAETWFYAHTEVGAVIRGAAEALKAAGEDHDTWFYMLPATQM
jgi:hypothetical protein